MIIKCACLCAAFRESKEEDMATKREKRRWGMAILRG
jgi:hypothetical protein